MLTFWYNRTDEGKGEIKNGNLHVCGRVSISPCIMCVQGCSVPWGNIMSTVGGYLEYRGGCSVPWGIS